MTGSIQKEDHLHTIVCSSQFSDAHSIGELKGLRLLHGGGENTLCLGERPQLSSGTGAGTKAEILLAVAANEKRKVMMALDVGSDTLILLH